MHESVFTVKFFFFFFTTDRTRKETKHLSSLCKGSYFLCAFFFPLFNSRYPRDTVSSLSRDCDLKNSQFQNKHSQKRKKKTRHFNCFTYMVSNQNCILAKAEIHKLLKLLFLWDFCFSEKSIKTLGALCQWFVSVLTTVAEFPEDTVCHWLSGGCAHITQERGDPKASSRTPLYGFVSCWKASLLLRANSSNRKFFLSLLLLVLKCYSVLHERGGGPAQVPCLDLGFGSHSVQADFWAVSLPPLPSLLSAIGPEFTVYTKAFSREGNYLVGEKAFPSSVVKGCTDHSGAFQCCAIDKDRRIGERTFKSTK